MSNMYMDFPRTINYTLSAPKHSLVRWISWSSEPARALWEALVDDCRWEIVTSTSGLHRTALIHRHIGYTEEREIGRELREVDHELSHLLVNHPTTAWGWCHGIHSLLELMVRRFPTDAFVVRDFIDSAYAKMTWLVRVSSEYQGALTECLDDLARYWDAIQESDWFGQQAWFKMITSRYHELRRHSQVLERIKSLEQQSFSGHSQSGMTVERPGRRLLPIMFGREETLMALPDTMADVNMITLAQAKSLGAVIKVGKKNVHVFRNALGQEFQSIGTTKLPMRVIGFPGGILKTIFAVVEQCPNPIVLSNSFLKKHSILTSFKHLLQRVSSKNWRLLYANAPQHQMACRVNGQDALLALDTGSDRNMMSRQYAKENDHMIHKLSAEDGWVQLSDCSRHRVDGYCDVDLTIKGEVSSQRFYVLKNMVADLILGDQAVEDLDVFAKQPPEISDVSKTVFDFCMIHWLGRCRESIKAYLSDTTNLAGNDIDLQALQRSSTSGLSAKLRKTRKFNGDFSELLTRELRAHLSRIDMAEIRRDKILRKRISETSDVAMASDLERENDSYMEEHQVLRAKFIRALTNLKAP